MVIVKTNIKTKQKNLTSVWVNLFDFSIKLLAYFIKPLKLDWSTSRLKKKEKKIDANYNLWVS